MKKYCYFSMLLALLVCSALIQPGFAYEKRALGEMFTSTTCGPCKGANDQLDKWIDPNHAQYVEDWIVIRYHMNWPAPGNDPFYLANPLHNNVRKNYYGVNYVPDMWLGDVHGTSSYGTWDNKALQQIGDETPFEIYLYGSFDPMFWELCPSVHITVDDDVLSGTYRMFMVVTQDEVAYNAPNGQNTFYQAMVTILNGTGGDILDPMAKGDYVTYDICTFLDPDWPSPSISIDYNKTNLTVFIQDNATKEIMQAATAKVVDLAPAPLWTDNPEISASVGADVDLNIDAGQDFAGRGYFLFTGVSGSSPGVALPGGSTVLPLKWDPYTDFMVSLVNSPIYANFMGNLDGDGIALANFNSFGPIDPGFVGFNTTYAWTCFNPFDRVSTPLEIPIIP